MDSLKRPETVITLVNTAALLGASIYFYRKINNLELELNKHSENLVSTIKKVKEIAVYKKHINTLGNAIKSLNETLGNTSREVETLKELVRYQSNQIAELQSIVSKLESDPKIEFKLKENPHIRALAPVYPRQQQYPSQFARPPQQYPQQQGYQAPHQQGYQAPLQQQGYQAPLQQQGYQAPLQQQGYQAPLNSQGYQAPLNPLQQQGYQAPLNPPLQQGYQAPLNPPRHTLQQGQGYQNPQQGQGYQNPQQGQGYQNPQQGQGYQNPQRQGGGELLDFNFGGESQNTGYSGQQSYQNSQNYSGGFEDSIDDEDAAIAAVRQARQKADDPLGFEM